MKQKLKYIAGYLTVAVVLCALLYLLLALSAQTFNTHYWPAYLRLVGIFGTAFLVIQTYNQLSPKWKQNDSPSQS